MQVRGMTKCYGHTLAVDGLSFGWSRAGSPASWGPTAPASPPRRGVVLGLGHPTAGDTSAQGAVPAFISANGT